MDTQRAPLVDGIPATYSMTGPGGMATNFSAPAPQQFDQYDERSKKKDCCSNPANGTRGGTSPYSLDPSREQEYIEELQRELQDREQKYQQMKQRVKNLKESVDKLSEAERARRAEATAAGYEAEDEPGMLNLTGAESPAFEAPREIGSAKESTAAPATRKPAQPRWSNFGAWRRSK
ncbi:MAG: hypothetical protein IT428_30235 [Planctomycetaceae bacterium]|nr:hypothetical protein [Planctomycetaceae bacterium]